MNRKQKKIAARNAFNARMVALKSSKAREYTVRLVFKRGKRRGAPTTAHVFLTKTTEMQDVSEARAAAKVRAETTKATGKTATGADAPLTFSEAWGIAFGVASKVGATSVALASGERFNVQTRQRVA